MEPDRRGEPPPEGRTAVIAGNGSLPIVVAKALADAGEPPFVVALRGEADPALTSYDHVEIGAGDLRGLMRGLKSAGVRRAVLAGGVKGRPKLSSLRLDLQMMMMIPSVINAMRKGDDGLLRAIIGHIESQGIKVVGAHEIVPDILAPATGATVTRKRPSRRDEADIDAAMRAACAIGDLDIGQGAVSVGGRVVALEGLEGTDQMLQRVAALRQEGRLKASGGVLLKCAKPRQEERADLPTIGEATVENASLAGLSGIAVEAGRSLVLGYGETIRRADALGLFITTFDVGGRR